MHAVRDAFAARMSEDAIPDVQPPAGPDAGQVALRQAEERTKLAVETACILKRIEHLDEEMSQYEQWQKYPAASYDHRVKLRYEEARRREAADARRRGCRPTSALSRFPAETAVRPWTPGASGLAPRSPPLAIMAPSPPPARQEGVGHEEHRLFAEHLRGALASAEFEAMQWRERACGFAHVRGEERDRADALVGFEMESAMRAAGLEREVLAANLRELQMSIELSEAELVASRAAAASSRAELGETKRRAVAIDEDLRRQRTSFEHLEGEVRARDERIAGLTRDMNYLRENGAAMLKRVQEDSEARLRDLEEAMERARAAAKSELESAHRELEATRADGQDRCQRMSEELTRNRGELQMAQAESERKARLLREAADSAEATRRLHDDELRRLKQAREEQDSRVHELEEGNVEARKLLGKAQLDRDVGQAEAKGLGDTLRKRDEALVNLQEELDAAQRDAKNHVLHVGRLQAEIKDAHRERDVARAELQAAEVESAVQRDRVQAKERELQAALVERDESAQAADEARRRAARLAVKIEGLETQMDNSNRVQADLAVEKESHRERADKMEGIVMSADPSAGWKALQAHLKVRKPGGGPAAPPLSAGWKGLLQVVAKKPADAPSIGASPSLPPVSRPLSARTSPSSDLQSQRS